jgi:hypothetical protein
VITGSEDAAVYKTPRGQKPVKLWDINFDPDENEGRMR